MVIKESSVRLMIKIQMGNSAHSTHRNAFMIACTRMYIYETFYTHSAAGPLERP